MKLRSICASLLTLLVVAGAALPSAFASDKRRIAILPFEYGAVTASVGTVDVGKGINTMLITRLVQDGTYSVVDRQMLDQVMKEQNLSVSDRADSNTACKIGKLLSVDAIVVGTVTQMGVEKKDSSVSVPSVGMGYIPYVGSIGGFGSLRSSKAKSKVAIDARIIDVNTGEVLATASGVGESTKKGGWSLNDSWDWSSGDFANTVAGEAIIAAVGQLTQQLEAAASKIPDNQSLAAQNVEGKIADVTGNTVIVNVGKLHGIKAGDTLQVERIVKEITDPNNPSKVIKKVTNTIAIINVTEADKDNSTGTITKGSGLRVGDLVKKVTTDVSAIVLTPIGGAATAASKKPTTK